MIKKYKLKGHYYYRVRVHYTDTKGKRHQKQFSHNQDGERIKSHIEAKLLHSRMLEKAVGEADGSYSDYTFREYHELFLQRKRKVSKAGTVYQYDGDLKKWLTKDFQNKPMKDFSTDYLEGFIHCDLVEAKATKHTQKRILKILRGIFGQAVRSEVIHRNPAEGVEKVKVPPTDEKALNPIEVQKLLEYTKQSSHPLFYHFAVALFSGMRPGEIYALRWNDIDLDTNTLTVRASWTNKDGYHSTKTNRLRSFEIGRELKPVLLELRGLGPFQEKMNGLNGSSFLADDLVLPRMAVCRNAGVAKVLGDICLQLGITKVKYKDLRATFITNCLRANVPLPAVMKIVGHAKMSTTDHYLRLAAIESRGEIDKLSYSIPQPRPQNVFDFSLYQR